MPVTRDFAGWMHVLPPMTMAEQKKYRHVVRVVDSTPVTAPVANVPVNNEDDWQVAARKQQDEPCKRIMAALRG